MILRAQGLFEEGIDVHYQIIYQDAIMTTPHSHEFYEIFLVIDGCMEHVKNGVAEKMGKDTLVFIRPEDEHYYRKIKGCLFNIAFKKDIFFLIESLLSVRSFEQKTLSDFDTAYIVNEISKIQSRKLQKAEISARLKRLLVNIFFFFMKPEDHLGYPAWFSELLNKMNNVQNMTAGLKQLYHLSPRSPEHTTRVFRKLLNKTPTEYINDMRLDYAKNILLSTDKSVTDVCFDVGFSDTSYFYVCFKRKYGSSPTEFRKTNKKELIF